MADFEVKGIKYRYGPMPLFDKFHVARKLIPVMAAGESLRGRFASMLPHADAGALTDDQSAELFNAALATLGDQIAKLPEEDCNFILNKTLAVVLRDQGGGRPFARVFEPRSSRMMFDDIDLPEMIQIVVHVLQGNITGFFPAGSAAAASPV